MQGKRKKCRWKKLHNDGSTLITVLVAVAFLVVLATMIISVSSISLKMKQTEYVMKRNFYSDELILDEVYHGIGKVTGDCLSAAYVEILSNVEDGSGTGLYDTQEKAYKAFSELFMNKLTAASNYPVRVCDATAAADPLRILLQSYLTKAETSAQIVKYKETKIVPTSAIDTTPFQYRFEDVVVKYMALDDTGAETGYEAAITTDIVIEVPYINFFQDSSRILDYALVGNQGIYFTDAERNVQGNVYAGSSDSESETNKVLYRNTDVFGGLNFYNSTASFESTYLITKGDMNVRFSDVSIGNPESQANTQVWAESLRTVESRNRSDAVEPSTVNIKGNTYIANDLELNARESNVKLAGTYYGYNNGIYETQEKSNLTGSYVSTGHTQSSAMMINGTRSTLDLSGLTTMVLAGVAYMDLDSNAYSAVPPAGNGGNLAGKIEEYATGESLALKTNQYMYLAPSVCLKTGNPVKTAEALPDSEVWIADANWFGTTAGYVNPSEPVISKVVTNRTTGVAYTYYFLNFIDGKKEAYANLVLNMIDPVNNLDDMDASIRAKYGYDFIDSMQLSEIWDIKKYLMGVALNAATNSTVTIADAAAATIYSRGALASVTTTTLGSQLVDEDNGLSLDQVVKVEQNIYKHYKWLYMCLDPQEQFSLTSNSIGSDPLASLSPTVDAAKLPISLYADLSSIVDNGTGTTYRCNGSYKTYIKPGDFTLSDADFKGIIICNGDVTISDGVSAEGLIIATGRIYVNGTGNIKANRSIVQQILDEEMEEEIKKESETDKNMGYACSYLKDFKPMYTGTDHTHRISGTDYTDYISYENWQKGE